MLDYGLHVATVGPAGVQELTAAEYDSTRLVQECAALFFDPLIDAVHTSVNSTNDLFDWAANVSSVDVAAFRAGRSRWLDEFERALNLAYEQRLAGRKRAARRPDGDAGDAGIRLLEASEQEAQIALVKAVRKLHRSAHREVSALNPRIALLLGEAKLTDTNNPFAPPYVLDAIGTSARTIYPESHAWRALMERVVADVTPVLFRIYVAQNRFLADHGVLPDIKALLRSRSAFRPAIDRDLVAAFRKLQSAAKTHQSFARPVRASELELAPEKSRSPLSLATETTAPSPVPRPPRHELPRAANTPSPDARLVADVRAAIAILVEKAAAEVPQAPASAISNLETSAVYVPGVVDRERASDALIGILGRLAQLDLRSAIADAAPAREGKTLLPSRVPANVVPDLRAVLAARIPSPEHGVVFDLVGHVFDAIWCDPSLPPPLHAPFERLQLPLLQVALADRDFFGNPEHPARRALNGLGEAAIGATDDAEYLARLLSVAQEAAAKACASGPPFELFEDIAAAVHSFIEADRKRTSLALAQDVAAATAAGTRDLAHSQARLMIQGRLAGCAAPERVREFAETVWVTYLTNIKRQGDADGSGVAAALRTLDDLLWSVSGSIRRGDRKGLLARIPSLVAELRRGCDAANLPPDKVDAILQEIFQHQSAGVKAEARAAQRAADARADAASPRDEAADDPVEPRVRDFVIEMIVGTWVRFQIGDEDALMRLCWASPMRDRYIFVGRGDKRARTLTLEDLVRALETRAAVVVQEPVPLMERAIDAAFDVVGRSASRNFSYTTPGSTSLQLA